MPPSATLVALGLLSCLTSFLLYYHVGTDALGVFLSAHSENQNVSEGERVPDLGHYLQLRELNATSFPIDNPSRRVIIIGDIHGSIRPLRKLLYTLDYNPSNDVLVHVGDTVTKAPVEDSLEVLKFLSAGNITGVRGNHDQLVLEWREWQDWVCSRPGGRNWLQRLEKKWQEAQARDEDVDLDKWIKKQRSVCPANDRKWWMLLPKGWQPLGDHYSIAKGMSKRDFDYILSLPLRLYAPHAHVFIFHGGMFAYNPDYSPDNKKKQPLAKIPVIIPKLLQSWNSSRPDTRDELIRIAQDRSLLSDIPQNQDPWITLNMRGVLHGKPTKDANEGVPWTNLWNDQMGRCAGYDTDGQTLKKKYKLPCLPSTTVYGHAAARGLDINRWSVGLDTGCIYGRKLSSLVLGRSLLTHSDDVRVQADSEYTHLDQKQSHLAGHERNVIPFGDGIHAEVVAIKCRP